MTTKQLKQLVLHAVRLKRPSACPKSIEFNQKRPVTWTRLIRSKWLLVASSDDVSSVITLWSVASPSLLTRQSPTPLAEAFIPDPVMTEVVYINGL
ncbi:hypothetical protein QCA50_020366 [Cerrena zonata]|uniref:Uncharacterized protein n=1 Tax=Cerrena zonata TaxID=2478898 RepID=A0AAW0FDD2_9APHY